MPAGALRVGSQSKVPRITAPQTGGIRRLRPMYPAGSGKRQPNPLVPGEPAARPAEKRDAPSGSPGPPEAAGVHRIRLRQPWESQATPRGTRWQRRFNRPTGIGPTQRVWILVQGVEAIGTAALNGKAIGTLSGHTDTPTVFDVTDLLEPHNRLELELEATGPLGPGLDSLPGQVWIEIRGQ